MLNKKISGSKFSAQNYGKLPQKKTSHKKYMLHDYICSLGNPSSHLPRMNPHLGRTEVPRKASITASESISPINQLAAAAERSGCWTKNMVFSPKMDGENNGKPYEQMDDLGVPTPIFGNTHLKIGLPNCCTALQGPFKNLASLETKMNELQLGRTKTRASLEG